MSVFLCGACRGVCVCHMCTGVCMKSLCRLQEAVCVCQSGESCMLTHMRVSVCTRVCALHRHAFFHYEPFSAAAHSGLPVHLETDATPTPLYR